MKLTLIGLVLFFSQSLFAQKVPADCDMRTNPHSYACTKWTFDGNPFFPLFQMDWENNLQGVWTPGTYAHPSWGNNSPDFAMFVNSQRPTIPMMVMDQLTRQQLGNFVIRGNLVSLNRWRGGINLQSVPSSLTIRDQFTAQFMVPEGDHWHSFTCRDFNRVGVHHLLCSWDMKRPESEQWEHRGILGFLKTAQ